MASSSIPKTQKGVIIEKNGGTEVLQYKTDLPVPEPKEGEVLVKNEYVGVNYIDTFVLPHYFDLRNLRTALFYPQSQH